MAILSPRRTKCFASGLKWCPRDGGLQVHNKLLSRFVGDDIHPDGPVVAFLMQEPSHLLYGLGVHLMQDRLVRRGNGHPDPMSPFV
jgi:hypothetical protein